MALTCGIIGLPNVGKSTIFSALTAASVAVSNYPFCTIEPNSGVVQVPDERLHRLGAVIQPERLVPATVTFIDIAGLVRGAARGEGLGNRFLGHIRDVTAIAHVVRCFSDDRVIHIHGEVDPVTDIEVVNVELALADLDAAQKRIARQERMVKSHDRRLAKRAEREIILLKRIEAGLAENVPVRAMGLSREELGLVREVNFLTVKPVLYVLNADDDSLEQGNAYIHAAREHAAKEGAHTVVLSGQSEAEIARMEERERREFMDMLGIQASGLSRLIQAAYHLLGYITFFTTQGPEVRAWNIARGTHAQEAAGMIHSDFARGFIRAEVYPCRDVVAHGSEAALRQAGKLRLEGKEYVVQDGDVIHFLFNP